jgi:hypothetical protein
MNILVLDAGLIWLEGAKHPCCRLVEERSRGSIAAPRWFFPLKINAQVAQTYDHLQIYVIG